MPDRAAAARVLGLREGEEPAIVLTFGYPHPPRRDPQSQPAETWVAAADRKPFEEVVERLSGSSRPTFWSRRQEGCDDETARPRAGSSEPPLVHRLIQGSEAAEGIRTLDLLHGKQNVWFRLCADIACKCVGSRLCVAACDSPAFAGKSREFGRPMARELAYPVIGGFDRRPHNP
jgi:hypothetical protein